MSRDEILQGIVEVTREKLDWNGPVHPGLRLVEDLELDSIRMLTLAMEVEDRFRICLDEEAEAAILTVGDLIDAVEGRLRDV